MEARIEGLCHIGYADTHASGIFSVGHREAEIEKTYSTSELAEWWDHCPSTFAMVVEHLKIDGHGNYQPQRVGRSSKQATSWMWNWRGCDAVRALTETLLPERDLDGANSDTNDAGTPGPQRPCRRRVGLMDASQYTIGSQTLGILIETMGVARIIRLSRNGEGSGYNDRSGQERSTGTVLFDRVSRE